MLRLLCIMMFLVCQGVFAEGKIIVGIAGGTGSGKTTLAYKIKEAFSGRAVLLYQDAYYKDFSNLPLEDRSNINFDHPDSIDFDLLKEHILCLKNGIAIDQPCYDFCTHSRKKGVDKLEPAEIILIEGILIFAVPEICELFDMKVFIDTDDDIRLLRRIERDINERARDLKGIQEQYTKTVKPMHEQYVRPSKQKADVIVPQGGENPMALSVIVSKLREAL